MTEQQVEAHQASCSQRHGRKVPVIGVVGGIGSGKSEVAGRLAQRGAAVLDADKVGHEVLADPEVKEALRSRWGDGVFDANGEVNRSAVAARVFGPTAQHLQDRRFLEAVSHPRIGQLLRDRIEQIRAASRIRAVVLDAALLFEAHWNSLCDWVLFVDAPRDVRRQRAHQRGWSDEDFTVREAAQGSLEAKRERSDIVLDNSGDRDHLFAQIDRWWHETTESH